MKVSGFGTQGMGFSCLNALSAFFFFVGGGGWVIDVLSVIGRKT